MSRPDRLARHPRDRAAIAPLASPTPAPVTLAVPPTLSTQYPHVDAVEDWRAQQSLRLLWDRMFDLEARLQAATTTLEQLTARSNDQDARLASVQRGAGEALAVAQAAAGSSGGLSPGEPASGPGSHGEPIIPMSADPGIMEGNIKASLYHFGRVDYSYWLSVVGEPWQGGDGKWYQGWDAYMEERASSPTSASASHDLLPLPAVYTTPPPPGYPSGGWT